MPAAPATTQPIALNLPQLDPATLLAALSRHPLLGRLDGHAQAAVAALFQCEALAADALLADAGA